MFDKLIRELRRLEGNHKLNVPINYDDDGYLDRQCPSSDCLFDFKVNGEDWAEKVRDEEVFCPFCGQMATSGKWMTQEQAQYALDAGVAHLQKRIGRALKEDASRWNARKVCKSFISVTLNVKDYPAKIFLPPMAAEPMRLRISCPQCSCRYAVIGAAFFCPACGHSAVELVFNQSIKSIRNVLDALSVIRGLFPDRDTAVTTERLLIEKGLQDAVTAFQRYAETLYERHSEAAPARRNAFQNLAEGSALWRAAFGAAYDKHLTEEEMLALHRFIQQRHLLAHTQGIVDHGYVERTGDRTYVLGQRLVIRASAVHECLDIIEKLSVGLASDKDRF